MVLYNSLSLKASVTLIGIIVIVFSTLGQYAWGATAPQFNTQWGVYGLNSNGQFAFPQGIAIDSSGNVYVTDLGNRRIQEFDNTGNFIFTWGAKGSGNGHFENPIGIAIGNGSIYVVDNDLNSVQKFDMKGQFVTQWGTRGDGTSQFLLPQGIAVDSKGNVYVVDTGNSRIEKFDSNGKFLLAFGESGLDDGKFLSPRKIAIDSHDFIYVADTGNNRVEKFGTDGTFIQTLGEHTASLTSPIGIAVDTSGNIYLADNGNNRVAELDNNGNEVTSWGSSGTGPDFFNNPRDIAVDSAGNVFVVDTDNNRIQKFGSQSITTPVSQTQSQNTNQTTVVQTTNQNTNQTTQSQTVQNQNNPQTPSQSLITDPSETTLPQITAPADMTVEANNMLTPVSIGQATATDAVKVASITNNAPSKFPLGTTMVTWTAMNAGGNLAKAVQKITVVDTTSPTLTAPPNVTVQATSQNHTSVDLGLPSAYDAVGVESVTNDAPPYFPLGQTIVTWKAIDVSGNVATAKQTVAIQYNTPPTIHAPADITIAATGSLTPVDIGQSSATDLIGIASLTNDAPNSFPLGTTTVTWTAVDAAGNTASAVQKITVVNHTPPKLTPPPNVTFEAASLNDNVVPIGNATAADFESVNITNNAPSSFQLGKTSVLWTATDKSGNTANATQIVNVVDTTPPKLTPPANVTFEATSLNDNVVPIGNATATDIEPVTITNNATKTFPLGKTTILWIANDKSGNISNATQIVDVVDTTQPKIVPPQQVIVNATSPTDNHVSIGNATASDNVQVVSITNNAPAVFPYGNTTIVWTARDEAGNTANAIQIINVVDHSPPTLVIPQNIITNATAFETPMILGQATATGIIDTSPKITNNSTGLFQIGTTIIQWKAVDKFGNTQTADQTVDVLACGKPTSSYNLLMGTNGDDTLTGSSVSNLIIGLGGNDILRAGPAGDCIIAGDGNNVIFGGSGNDIIMAGNGDNIIRGGSGNEQIYVGTGSNIIQGGTGHDTCYLGDPSKDTVVDCQALKR